MRRALFPILAFAFLTGVLVPAWAQNVNGTTGNFPFPQNKDNPYGFHSSIYNNADILAAYNKWYSSCITSSGAGGFLRIQRPDDSGLNLNSTVSEGIGYAMVIAVYMNDENLLDNIWKYEQLHLDRSDGTGLMNWYINADGTLGPNGNGAATDGDEDMAWALLMASRQWGGSGTLSNTYLNLAVAQINNIYSKEVSGGVLVAGDGWTPINPSYFAPAYYREFAAATGQNGWLTVAANCYTVLNANLSQGYGNTTNGLDSAWCSSAGVSVNQINSNYYDYQYDACRTPFRIVQDYIWFGNSSAQSYDTKTSNFFSGIGAVSIVDGYHLDGTKDAQLPTLTVSQNPGFQSAAFVGPAGCGAMISNSYQGYLDSTYSDLVGSKLLVGGTYYDESWTVMSLLMLSDNFLDYNMYIPPTPTPTLSAYAPMTLRVNCGGPQFADNVPQTWLADQQYSGAVSWGWVASANNVSTYTATIAGALYNQQTLYETERWGNPTYQFTVPNGYYQVLFKFCENYDPDSHVGGRVFSVVEAGEPVITNLDVYATVGEHVAYDVPTTCVVSTGQLDIVFSSTADKSQVNAIQIIRLQTPPTPTVTSTKQPTATDTPTPKPTFTPGGPPTSTPTITLSPTVTFTSTVTSTNTWTPTVGSPTVTPTLTPTFTVTETNTPTPIYVNCAGSQYVSASTGITWLADQAFSTGSWGYTAGSPYTSGGPITNTVDPTLYETERAAGGVTYKFTLPNGVYDAVLKYAETYYTSIGGRVFNVALNGVTVLSNFDIYKDSGGKNIADDKTFAVTVTSGILELDETATVQIATIQAIGITYVVPPAFTPTSTQTFTFTSSSTPTPTLSYTPVFTTTPTNSRTSTFTSTVTPTLTNTSSPSVTGTSTPTATFTNTSLSTTTPTYSRTSAFTATATPTLTNTPSSSATGTSTPTATYTNTSLSTTTPTFTATRTSTSTPTSSNTWTGTPTLSPTKTLTPVFSYTVTNTPTITWSPTMTPTLLATDTSTTTPTHTTTAVFSATYTLTPSVTATQTATLTSTASRTFTPIFSHTLTMTYTLTPSPTDSWTTTVTITPTALITYTSTLSPTPHPVSKPILYPNPADGTRPVLLRFPSTGTSEGKIQIFTTAFRKVLEIPVHAQNGGTDLSFELKDSKGNLLASGLYYIVLINDQGKQILKLLVLR